MIDRTIGFSPKLYSRIGGALYLMLIALGIFGQVVKGKVIVSGDAAATSANLRSMETLWRFGLALELISLICVVALAMIYFVLLRPVNKEINLLATFLRMIGIAVEAVAALNLAAALFPLGSATYLKAFTPEQLYAMTSLAIKSHDYGYTLALLFFGFTFLFHGHLIARSGFLPRVLGLMIQVGGVCYLSNSLVFFLAPGLSGALFPWILLPCFVAELSLALWLLAKGVNVPRWNERASLGE
ncbi:MAG: hypothetical protein QOH88_2215 [Verrucomicrobiota bacterium]|jgi:hypothetical protein